MSIINVGGEPSRVIVVLEDALNIKVRSISRKDLLGVHL